MTFNPFLSQKQQEIVVFPIWQSMAYWQRILVGFTGILAGLVIQYHWWHNTFLLAVSFFPILAGNLLLTVRGYDNRTKFGKYRPEAEWEPVSEEKILEVEQLIKKMKKWDRSLIDVSNPLGKVTFVILFIVIVVLFIAANLQQERRFAVFAINAIILFLPHWISGTRSIQTQPNLLFKLDMIKYLLRHREITERLQPHEVEYLLQLNGTEEKKVPEDIKLRIKFDPQDPGFLGYYCQIVVNRVKDKKYPYFYVVLVAKDKYGLRRIFTPYTAPRRISKEFKKQEDVEVIVIRQATTRTSGYHTNNKTVRKIFLEGLALAEEAAVKKKKDDK